MNCISLLFFNSTYVWSIENQIEFKKFLGSIFCLWDVWLLPKLKENSYRLGNVYIQLYTPNKPLLSN